MVWFLKVIVINGVIPESFESSPYSIQNVNRKKLCLFYSIVFLHVTPLLHQVGDNYVGGQFSALLFRLANGYPGYWILFSTRPPPFYGNPRWPPRFSMSRRTSSFFLSRNHRVYRRAPHPRETAARPRPMGHIAGEEEPPRRASVKQGHRAMDVDYCLLPLLQICAHLAYIETWD